MLTPNMDTLAPYIRLVILIGRTAKGKIIIYNGKKYHDKSIRTKYKGELKPFAKELKKALENGEAYYKKTDGKYIYKYDLEKRR
jgi:hypothetical protein